MSTRRAWSLFVYALVACLLAFLWLQDDEREGDGFGDETADEAGAPPPMLETRTKPSSGSDTAAVGTKQDARAPETWPYRVHTNVAGATVTLHVSTVGKMAAPAPVTKTADRDGFAGFEIPALDVVHPLVEAEAGAPGYRTMRRRLVGGEVRMRLVKGHAVRGHVYGHDGAPLKGAWLRLDSVAARSNADGSFTVYANKPHESHQLFFDHRAHLDGRKRVACPSNDVVVRLERGAVVEGRVTFPDGSPVPGVRVSLTGRQCYAVTRANGTYTLSGLRPGMRLRLDVMGRSHWFLEKARSADMTVNEHVVHFTFRSPVGKTVRDLYVTSGVERENGVETRSWGWAKNGSFMARTPLNATVIYAWVAPHIEMGTRELITEADPRVYHLTETLLPVRAYGRISVMGPFDWANRFDRRKHRRLDVFMPSGQNMLGFGGLRFELQQEDESMLLEPMPPGRYGVRLHGFETQWIDVVPNDTTDVVFSR